MIGFAINANVAPVSQRKVMEECDEARTQSQPPARRNQPCGRGSQDRRPMKPHATRGQRVAAATGLVLTLCLFFYLFSSILLPFVAAAGIAYFSIPSPCA